MAPDVLLVRGAGDLASGAALRLHRAGFSLLMAEIEQPLAVRRAVAFSEAVYEGRVVVEGVAAVQASGPEEAVALLEDDAIPVLVDPELEILWKAPEWFRTPVVVDARLLKREVARVPADLLIGLGPGFTPGENCDAVVETLRGHNLGRVHWSRPARADTGLPDGDPARVLRAPAAGLFLPDVSIGDAVTRGEILASIRAGDGGEVPVLAPLDGVVRGLLRPGMRVSEGLKIGDIDARGQRSYAFTASDKALAVGGGVLEAVLSRPGIARRLLRRPPFR